MAKAVILALLAGVLIRLLTRGAFDARSRLLGGRDGRSQHGEVRGGELVRCDRCGTFVPAGEMNRSPGGRLCARCAGP